MTANPETTTYPKIGSKVSFIRRRKGEDGKPEIVTGEGILLSIHMGPDKRLMSQIKEGDQIFNTNHQLVNPDGEMLEKYKELCSRTDELTDAGNEESRKVVENANKAIDDEIDAVLGPAVSF